jgi:hypothetical protein
MRLGDLQKRYLLLLARLHRKWLCDGGKLEVREHKPGDKRGPTEPPVDATPLQGLLQAELAVDPTVLPRLLPA